MNPDTRRATLVLVRFDALGRILAPFTPEPLPMFKLEIDTGNAAFDIEENGLHGEAARILRQLAAELVNNGGTSGALFDVNGNRVGAWSLSQ